MAKKIKEVKPVKFFLKQKRAHPKGFRLGRHLIPMGPAKEYELDGAEQKELETIGPKAWLKKVTKEEMEAAPKSNKENKDIQTLKKFFIEKEVALSGEESLEDLKELKDTVEMVIALRAKLDEKEISYEADATVEELEALLG